MTSAEPLEITLESTMLPLRKPALLLLEGVAEKKIRIGGHSHGLGALAHSHDAPGGRTESALEGGRGSESAAEALEATENGQPLPSGDGWATINRGLAEGDKVIMLRVSRGQRYIVLSRAL